MVLRINQIYVRYGLKQLFLLENSRRQKLWTWQLRLLWASAGLLLKVQKLASNHSPPATESLCTEHCRLDITAQLCLFAIFSWQNRAETLTGHGYKLEIFCLFFQTFFELNIVALLVSFILFSFFTVSFPLPLTLFHFPDNRMIKVNGTREPLEFKSHQWFGASVRTHKGKVVVRASLLLFVFSCLLAHYSFKWVFIGVLFVVQACAPLYHWRTVKLSGEKDPVGTCYVAVQNFSAYAEYSPCRTSESLCSHDSDCLHLSFTAEQPSLPLFFLLSAISRNISWLALVVSIHADSFTWRDIVIFAFNSL